MNPDLYQKVSRFAAEAHAGQLVPGTQVSYLLHLMQVSAEVLNLGLDLSLRARSSALNITNQLQAEKGELIREEGRGEGRGTEPEGRNKKRNKRKNSLQ